jgi:hypothetical protein
VRVILVSVFGTETVWRMVVVWTRIEKWRRKFQWWAPASEIERSPQQRRLSTPLRIDLLRFGAAGRGRTQSRTPLLECQGMQIIVEEILETRACVEWRMCVRLAFDLDPKVGVVFLTLGATRVSLS